MPIPMEQATIRWLSPSDQSALGGMVAKEGGTALGIPRPASVAEAQAWIEATIAERESGEVFTFAVVAGGLVGTCRLRRKPGEAAVGQLSYWVAPAYRGLGHATSAARMAMQFAEERLGISTFDSFVRPDNAASLRVVRKLGFVQGETYVHDVQGRVIHYRGGGR